MDGGLPCHVLALSGLQHAAHVDLVHLIRLYARTLQRFSDDDGSQIRRRNAGKLSAHRADGGSAGACQNYFSAHGNVFLRFLPPQAAYPSAAEPHVFAARIPGTTGSAAACGSIVALRDGRSNAFS